jgi:trk system potassium uptake protein TrkH
VTGVAAVMNTVGPGMGALGGIEDFHLVTPFGKIVLTLCMLLGRLELYTICVMFLPAFWHKA